MNPVYRSLAVLVLGITALGVANAVPLPVATYSFNNTLASGVAGAPSLVATDPLGLSGFGTDTVFGNTQTVYNFNGLESPVTDQAGLTLNTTGLLTNNSIYSVEMIFKFTQRQNAWRRILDVENRQSDNGFYVDPANNLNVFPIGGGSAFTNDVYHDVFLVNNNGSVTFYLDGSAQATVATSEMNIDSLNPLMNFFLDNVVAGGQFEYSNGSIAYIGLYNAALTELPPPPISPVPVPASLALLGLGLAGLGFNRRRKPV